MSERSAGDSPCTEPFLISAAACVLRISEDGKAALCDASKRCRVENRLALDGCIWVPKSVLHAESQVRCKDTSEQGTLVVERWFAEKRGLV